MPITETGKKIGQTTWQATVLFDDGTWPDSVAFAEYPEKELAAAKTWASAALLAEAAKDRPASKDADTSFTPYCYAEIKRGTYRDGSFTDPELGLVADGDWERDESGGGYWYGSMAETGEGVEWDQH